MNSTNQTKFCDCPRYCKTRKEVSARTFLNHAPFRITLPPPNYREWAGLRRESSSPQAGAGPAKRPRHAGPEEDDEGNGDGGNEVDGVGNFAGGFEGGNGAGGFEGGGNGDEGGNGAGEFEGGGNGDEGGDNGPGGFEGGNQHVDFFRLLYLSFFNFNINISPTAT